VSRSLMAESLAAGLRCMYRSVVVGSAWPAISWIAFALLVRGLQCKGWQFAHACKRTRPELALVA